LLVLKKRNEISTYQALYALAAIGSLLTSSGHLVSVFDIFLSHHAKGSLDRAHAMFVPIHRVVPDFRSFAFGLSFVAGREALSNLAFTGDAEPYPPNRSITSLEYLILIGGVRHAGASLFGSAHSLRGVR
jgi:hypothetical protein